jgi:hypothetical protein
LDENQSAMKLSQIHQRIELCLREIILREIILREIILREIITNSSTLNAPYSQVYITKVKLSH